MPKHHQRPEIHVRRETARRQVKKILGAATPEFTAIGYSTSRAVRGLFAPVG